MHFEWNLRRVLDWSVDHLKKNKISESPRLDVELLLAKTLNMSRVQLYCDLDRPLTNEEKESFKELYRRRCLHEPIAYLLGEKEFFGRKFLVNQNTLIPRPDSECIIEEALARIAVEEPILVLDIGTGSGCLGITLALEFPNARVDAWECSDFAIQVARENSRRFELESRVDIEVVDILDQKIWAKQRQSYDLVVANLPYIGRNECDLLSKDVLDFEPHLALFGGDVGVELIHVLLDRLAILLKGPSSIALVEIGYNQAEALIKFIENNISQLQFVGIRKDYSEKDRVLILKLRN